MPSVLVGKRIRCTLILTVALLFLGTGICPIFMERVYAANAQNRSLTLSNSVPAQVATYRAGFTITTVGTLGSIKIEFCENTALFGVPCNAPAGFDVSNAVLSAQTGETGFVIHPATTANVLILSRTPTAAAAVPVTYTLDNVHNASAQGTQYARYSTYATIDASGASTDEGAVAYSLNPSFQVSAEVPPFLQLCIGVTITGTDCSSASGSYINLGEFSTSAASTGQTQAVIGTNAPSGYILAVSGGTMTSGNNTIPALAQPTSSSPGTSQFGINLRANTSPQTGQDPGGAGSGQPAANYNQPNRFTYNSSDVIASYNNAEDFRKYTVTYLVNIGVGQPPGVYSSTFTYTATGNF